MNYFVWHKDKWPYELILQVDSKLYDAWLWTEISKTEVLASKKYKTKIYSISDGKMKRWI
jgi:hypothetical protein